MGTMMDDRYDIALLVTVAKAMRDSCHGISGEESETGFPGVFQVNMLLLLFCC